MVFYLCGKRIRVSIACVGSKDRCGFIGIWIFRISNINLFCVADHGTCLGI